MVSVAYRITNRKIGQKMKIFFLGVMIALVFIETIRIGTRDYSKLTKNFFDI